MYGRTVLGIAPELFDGYGSTDEPAQLVGTSKR
jgi:pyruvate,orthophosphate dikinase